MARGQRLASQATQTDACRAHGGPTALLGSSSAHPAACACWCLVAEVSCALNGAAVLVFWRRATTVGPALSPAALSCYHAALAGCFFHLVGSQVAVQLALRRVASLARHDVRPQGLGRRSPHTNAWPSTLWFVLSLLPAVVPQLILIHDADNLDVLSTLPAYPVFVLAMCLSVILGATTLAHTWCHWVVDMLQRGTRRAATEQHDR